MVLGLRLIWEFPKIRGPYLGVLKILPFRGWGFKEGLRVPGFGFLGFAMV